MKENQLLDGHLSCIAGTEKKTSDSTKTVVPRDLVAIWVSLVLGLTASVVAFALEIFYFRRYDSSASKTHEQARNSDFWTSNYHRLNGVA